MVFYDKEILELIGKNELMIHVNRRPPPMHKYDDPEYDICKHNHDFMLCVENGKLKFKEWGKTYSEWDLPMERKEWERLIPYDRKFWGDTTGGGDYATYIFPKKWTIGQIGYDLWELVKKQGDNNTS